MTQRAPEAHLHVPELGMVELRSLMGPGFWDLRLTFNHIERPPANTQIFRMKCIFKAITRLRMNLPWTEYCTKASEALA